MIKMFFFFIFLAIVDLDLCHLSGPNDASSQSGKSEDTAAVVVPVLFLLLVGVCGGLVVLYLRHRRLQHSFTAFANSHYNSRLGSAIFSSGDELGKTSFQNPLFRLKLVNFGLDLFTAVLQNCHQFTLVQFSSLQLFVDLNSVQFI